MVEHIACVGRRPRVSVATPLLASLPWTNDTARLTSNGVHVVMCRKMHAAYCSQYSVNDAGSSIYLVVRIDQGPLGLAQHSCPSATVTMWAPIPSERHITYMIQSHLATPQRRLSDIQSRQHSRVPRAELARSPKNACRRRYQLAKLLPAADIRRQLRLSGHELVICVLREAGMEQWLEAIGRGRDAGSEWGVGKISGERFEPRVGKGVVCGVRVESPTRTPAIETGLLLHSSAMESCMRLTVVPPPLSPSPTQTRV
jgi:hypothetical protein